MTEADAWRLVLVYLYEGRKPPYICWAITHGLPGVPNQIKDRMTKRLDDNKPSPNLQVGGNCSWWPNSKEGQQERIAFVKRMIGLCEGQPALTSYTIDVGCM